MNANSLKRRFAATILCYAVNIALLTLLAANSNAQTPPSPGNSPISSTQPQAESFPLFGVRLKSPPQWQQLPPDRLGIVARWISSDSKPGDVHGMIMVEMKMPGGADAAQIAGQLANNWGGTVATQAEQLDGEVAWRVTADPKVDLQPVEALVAVHDSRLYLIEGGVTAGHTCHDQIETICNGWKWIPLDSPVKHLEFSNQSTLIFNGQVAINFPAAMYVFDKDQPDRRLGIGLQNYQIGQDDFTALYEFAQLSEGDTLASAESRLANGIRAKLNLPEAFVWQPVSGATLQAAATQALPGPVSDRKNWIMWGIVGLPGNQIVLVNFTIFAEDPAERAIYAKTAEAMLAKVSMPQTAPAAK
jgi:hypothetical protein